MGKDRSRTRAISRKENVREERKVIEEREFLNFSFKFLDETQPKVEPETIELWEQKGLLNPLIVRLKELSKLTLEEALTQKQLKIYNEFPPAAKTDFFYPEHVAKNVAWGVVMGMSGKPRLAGFISRNTFYVVFLDRNHRFWITELKNT